MTFDKKDIILSVGGTIAAIAVAYLIYKMQQRDAAQQAANSANADAEIESELANQQSAIASLPSVSVPTISSTPSSTDVVQQSQSPASGDELAAIISAFQSSDNTSVTSAITPIASLDINNLLPSSTVGVPVASPPTQPIAPSLPPVTAHPVTTTDTGVNS